MSKKRQRAVEQVVVIGGSMTGLLAAAALAGEGRTVTIVERDILPDTPQPRAGVPQGQQAHILLYRGLLAAEELLPGLRQDLLAAGAVPVNGGQLLWMSESGWLPTNARGFEIVSTTRPLLEHVVRRRTLELPGVSTLQGQRVRGLQPHSSCWEVQLEDGSTLAADLVLDASGRSSRLPVWLSGLGVSVPDSIVIDARVGYATRMYGSVPSLLADCAGILVAATADTLMGGVALPVEEGRWLVLAVGLGDHRPPRDSAGFEAFLAALADPSLAEFVSMCQPIGDPQIHRQTSNARHPYDKISDWPTGLIAVGDAACAFNPVYGQGITVGAIQAQLLRRAATSGLTPADTPRLQRRVAASVNTAWSIATSTDLRFPTSAGRLSRLQVLLAAWSLELGRLTVHGNRRAGEYTNGVYNLVSSPAVLAHPALIAAAVVAHLRGYGPATGRPTLLNDLSALSSARTQRSDSELGKPASA